MTATRAEEPAFELLTPEQVPIHLRLGDLGSRFGAVAIDLGVQGLLLVALVLVLQAFGGEASSALLLLAAFVLRNFYFTFGEIHGYGRTFGKRLCGLRVVAQDGGPLTIELLFARNLTRELEIFLPLSALTAPATLIPDAPLWVQGATIAWITALTLLPLTNPYRARLGDLLAGTVVVMEPKTDLDFDLVEEAQQVEAITEYVFTSEQLDVYGIHELQVLEEVLRRPPSDQREELERSICDKICSKLDWRRGEVDTPRRFLQAFYSAQRHRLEKRLLFGERRERKVR